MTLNPIRELMTVGNVAVGGAVRLGRTPEIVTAFKTAGLNWLFLDLEHGPHSIDTVSQIAMTALHAGLSPIARVPAGEFGMATRLLDNGAMGLVMPHVDTAAQARQLVEKLRFPPIGTRSVYGGMPQFGFAPRGIAEASEILNRETLVIVMLESTEAIANAAEIAATPGVDVLFVGANDLCVEMGIPGGFHNPRFIAAMEETIAACRFHGKWAGLGGMYDADLLDRFIASGVQFVLAGSDLSFLMAEAKRVSTRLCSGQPAVHKGGQR